MNALEELVFFNKLEEEIVVFGGKWKIKWHTLDGEEYTGALQSTPAFDDVTRMQMLKQEKLARAIDSINGQTWLTLIPEDKRNTVTPLEKAREIVKKWQRATTDYMYLKYEMFEQKSNQTIQELEKSFLTTRPQTSDSSGK
jgi:hypothetical protein